MIAAPDTSRPPIAWCVRKYPSGSAQITVVTSSGWMIETRPVDGRPPQAIPTSCATRPRSHTHRVSRTRNDFG
jgi:hypothetical protein